MRYHSNPPPCPDQWLLQNHWRPGLWALGFPSSSVVLTSISFALLTLTNSYCSSWASSYTPGVPAYCHINWRMKECLEYLLQETGAGTVPGEPLPLAFRITEIKSREGVLPPDVVWMLACLLQAQVSEWLVSAGDAALIGYGAYRKWGLAGENGLLGVSFWLRFLSHLVLQPFSLKHTEVYVNNKLVVLLSQASY